jgi:hypothetical protein
MSDRPDQNSSKIPDYLLEALVREGVDVENPDVRAIVASTHQAVTDHYRELLVPALTELRGATTRTFEATGHLTTQMDQHFTELERAGRSFRFLLVVAIGIASIGATLLAGFPQFVSGIRHILTLSSASHGILLFGTAYAETTAQSSPTATVSQVAPVLVYGVYVLLAIAYVASLMVLLIGGEARKDTALEIFKGLNAFFIGAVSGKLV